MKLEILDGTLDCLFVFSTNFARNVSGNVTNSMFFVVLLMVRRGVGQRPMCRGCLVDLVETETAVVSDRVDRPMGAWLMDVGKLHVDVVCLLSFLFGV